jgi:hypothetical protein
MRLTLSLFLLSILSFYTGRVWMMRHVRSVRREGTGQWQTRPLDYPRNMMNLGDAEALLIFS